jgi:hypothetical protein
MRTHGIRGQAALIALAAGLATTTGADVRAQTPEAAATLSRPGIKVAPVILAEPEVETLLNIQVGPEAAVPRQTFLRVRGLPLAVRLSDGHVVTPGLWAVPLASLPTLRVLAPLSSSGRTEIQFALVGVDGGLLAEAKTSLVVAPAWLLGSGSPRPDAARQVPSARLEPPPAPVAPAPVPPPQRAATVAMAGSPSTALGSDAPTTTEVEPAARAVAAASPPAPVPVPVTAPPQAVGRAEPQAVIAALPPPSAAATVSTAVPAPRPALPPAVKSVPTPKAPLVLSADERQRAEALVQRGDVFLRQGNVAAARQFYRRAAEMGLGAAALKMGSTYDPVELAAQSVVGLAGDRAEAGVWYEKARELGAPEAGARLSRLQGR